MVDWKSRELIGFGPNREPNKFPFSINFWEAKGIYVLLREFKTIYVGQAFAGEGSIAKRLYDHLSDRHAGRWDMFSWYSVSKPNKTNKTVSKCENRQLKLNTAVDTLEALAILITDPPLNRKRNSIPGAIEFQQTGKLKPKSTTQYLEEILSNLSNPNQS